jgi:hypothetical protein
MLPVDLAPCELADEKLESISKITTSDWYSSGCVLGAVPRPKIGRPDYSRFSTSRAEIANLAVRNQIKTPPLFELAIHPCDVSGRMSLLAVGDSITGEVR